jgi:hypothetical protein
LTRQIELESAGVTTKATKMVHVRARAPSMTGRRCAWLRMR